MTRAVPPRRAGAAPARRRFGLPAAAAGSLLDADREFARRHRRAFDLPEQAAAIGAALLLLLTLAPADLAPALFPSLADAPHPGALAVLAVFVGSVLRVALVIGRLADERRRYEDAGTPPAIATAADAVKAWDHLLGSAFALALVALICAQWSLGVAILVVLPTLLLALRELGFERAAFVAHACKGCDRG